MDDQIEDSFSITLSEDDPVFMAKQRWVLDLNDTTAMVVYSLN